MEARMALAAWRVAGCFTDAERAALALAGAVTRLGDGEDSVPAARRQAATPDGHAHARSVRP